jgi:hypothetical protein
MNSNALQLLSISTSRFPIFRSCSWEK